MGGPKRVWSVMDTVEVREIAAPQDRYSPLSLGVGKVREKKHWGVCPASGSAYPRQR